MPNVVDNSANCGDCGYIFHGDDVDQETGKRRPCPKCGSLKRILFGKVEMKSSGKLVTNLILQTNMTPESWTILGLFLGLIIPPIFFIVFTMLDVNIGYKLLIWLGVILAIFSLTRCFRFIKFLKRFANKSYGKQ
jgi:DNA-directed RNA polymerase subunit RPC12/RpoP